MKPLLAHICEPHRITYPCFVQPKLNGVRALYQTGADGVGRFQSRDEIPFPEGLLDHLTKSLQSLFDQAVILDGELYVHGWPLQRINAAVTPVRQTPTEDTPLVEYHVFDRVDYGLPFIERWKLINQYLDPGPGWFESKIQRVLTVKVTTEESANERYASWVSQGYEGLMYRTGDCPYTLPKQPAVRSQSSRLKFLSDQDNRVWHLLKRKDWQDGEYVVTRLNEGNGKYADMLGSFSFNNPSGQPQMYDALFKGDPRVGSGLTDAQREKYWDHPELVIGKLIKVKYLCLSSSGIPLNPTILLIP